MIDIVPVLQAANTLIQQQPGTTITIQQLPEVEGVKFFNQYVVPAIVFIAGIIGLVIFLKIRAYYTEFAGSGPRKGKFWFMIQKGDRFACNVNEVEVPFDDEMFYILKNAKNEEKIKQGAEEIEAMVKRREFFVYDIKITDRRYAFDLKGGESRGLLLSSAPIDDKTICFQDKYGYTTINSFPNKEFPWVVFCHFTSRFFPAKTPDGNVIPCWTIAPIPMTNEGEVPFGFSLDDLKDRPHILQVKVLPNMKNIAEAVLNMKPLAKILHSLEIKNIELAKMQERLEEKDMVIAEMRLEIDEANMEAHQKPLEGEMAKPEMPPKGFPFGWCFAFGIAGLLGYALPNYVPQMASFPPLLSGMIGIIVMAVVAYYVNRDTSKEVGRLEKLENE